MKPAITAIAATVIFASALHSHAATPVLPGPATATAPPIAPAIDPAAGDVRAANEKFALAMFSGDLSTVHALMMPLPDGDKADIEVFLAKQLADSVWQRAVAEKFGLKVDAPSTKQIPGLDDPPVKVSGDTAEVDMAGQTVYLARDTGMWKVDLSKSLKKYLTDQIRKELAAAAPELKIREQTLADLKAGKFKSPDQANDELKKRLASIGGGGPLPTDQKMHDTLQTYGKIENALETFFGDNDRFPTTAEGLDALVHKPAGPGMDHWKQCLDAVPLDAWGHPFSYAGPAKPDGVYRIVTAGPDGKLGTDDDFPHRP